MVFTYAAIVWGAGLCLAAPLWAILHHYKKTQLAYCCRLRKHPDLCGGTRVDDKGLQLVLLWGRFLHLRQRWTNLDPRSAHPARLGRSTKSCSRLQRCWRLRRFCCVAHSLSNICRPRVIHNCRSQALGDNDHRLRCGILWIRTRASAHKWQPLKGHRLPTACGSHLGCPSSMVATSVMSGSSRPALRSSAKSAATRVSQALPASADTVLPLCAR